MKFVAILPFLLVAVSAVSKEKIIQDLEDKINQNKADVSDILQQFEKGIEHLEQTVSQCSKTATENFMSAVKKGEQEAVKSVIDTGDKLKSEIEKASDQFALAYYASEVQSLNFNGAVYQFLFTSYLPALAVYYSYLQNKCNCDSGPC